MLGEKYIQVLLILLIHLVALILIMFKTTGLLFRLELLLFLFLLFISLIFLFGLFFEEGWAWVLVMLFFAVNLVNIIFLKTIISDNLILFGILIVVDFIGFFKAIANIGEEEEDMEIEPYESEEKKVEKEAPKVEIYNNNGKKSPSKKSKNTVKKKAKKKSSKKI
ncbi:MAG: hypothetical protein V1740_03840 [Candidatus Woesearchaeota archaeon]